MPFGVELPDNIGETPAVESTAPAGSEATQSLESKVSESTTTPEATKSPLDLDKLEKVLFQGKEWTPKELKSSLMAHQDYTRKTIELSEARKYVDNFEIDLERVRRDPALMQQFRAVYPKQFADAAERLLQTGKSENANPVPGTQSTAPQDKDLTEIKAQWAELKKSQEEAEAQKLGAWLEGTMKTLETKYPIMNPVLQEVVYARAKYLADRGTDITDKVLDKLCKQVSDEVTPLWEKRYKEKVDKQLEVGSKGKDMGSGGGVPGSAPKGHKTMKEARAALEAHFDT